MIRRTPSKTWCTYEKLAAVALLEVDNVSRRFGGILALDEVSLTVDEDEIAGLIGPNGAGKTTAFNVITRLYKPNGGAVRYEGKDLLRQPAHRIVRLGIARTFQNLQLCAHMTVLDNVLVGAHSRIGLGDERKVRAEALEILDSLDLVRLAPAPAAGLPFGTLKRIELARALAARPKLLLLDEPAGGLSHEAVGRLASGIALQYPGGWFSGRQACPRCDVGRSARSDRYSPLRGPVFKR